MVMDARGDTLIKKLEEKEKIEGRCRDPVSNTTSKGNFNK